MFDNIALFLKELFVKIGSILPSSPFDLDSQLAGIRQYMGYVNYFIPFYIFKDIFNLWLLCVFGSFGVYLFIKFTKGIVGK